MVRDWFKLRRTPPMVVRYALGGVCVGLLLLTWWYLTRGAISEERIIAANKLPSPGESWERLGPLFGEKQLIGNVLTSLRRVLFGFGLAIIIGVPLGVVAASWRPVEAFLAPITMFGRNVPFGALVPFTLMLFGLGEKQIRMFIFLATIPFIFAATVSAVMSIHERYAETAKTLGASDRQVVIKVLFPLALPDIVTSVRQLFGLAFGYIMLAEVVGSGEQGAGFLLNSSQSRGGDQGSVVVILFVLAFTAFLIDRVLHFLQKGIFPYRQDL